MANFKVSKGSRNLTFSKSEAIDCQLRNSKTDYRLLLTRTSTVQKSFVHSGANVWNGLDSGVKESSSLCLFRGKYKTKNINQSMTHRTLPSSFFFYFIFLCNHCD